MGTVEGWGGFDAASLCMIDWRWWDLRRWDGWLAADARIAVVSM